MIVAGKCTQVYVICMKTGATGRMFHVFDWFENVWGYFRTCPHFRGVEFHGTSHVPASLRRKRWKKPLYLPNRFFQSFLLVVSNIFAFSSLLGKDSHFEEHIVQMGYIVQPPSFYPIFPTPNKQKPRLVAMISWSMPLTPRFDPSIRTYQVTLNAEPVMKGHGGENGNDPKQRSLQWDTYISYAIFWYMFTYFHTFTIFIDIPSDLVTNWFHYRYTICL